ncbi:hypothetical protein [Amycolatopsis sp. 195334CR]|uniref:hypothetical protein n=1 Tax=Amycolatopsis sp. 195334CR TaxID=2814588 RepID=UPI001A8F0FBB|nr:hypothetical protein [Amycolatopsis sp. 195334CR]MBN6042258.1 hypothetical protein [Amycolatopsis sp. 195334CR]
MRKGTRISLGVLVVAAAAAGAAPGVAAEAPKETRVVGSAGAHLPGQNGPGDPVRFSVDARRSAEGVSSGRFHVNHLTTGGQLFADFEGRVDCALAADGMGVVTGIIERADLPGAPPGLDLVGRRVGISVRDNRHAPDAIGWSWSTGGFEHDTLPCTSTIPFLRVDQGGYHVTGNAFG